MIGIDDRQAHAIAGVVEILSHENAPRIAREGVLIPLQAPIVHFAGQAVAVVVAETLAQARRAAAAVEVSYEELPAVTAIGRALDPPLAPLTPGGTATDSPL